MTPKRGDAGLEVVENRAASANASAQPQLAAGTAPPTYEVGRDDVSLREYLDVVLAGRWIILTAVTVVVALGLAYALLAPPVYRSDALVQVEDKKTTAGLLGDLASAFAESSPAETEIEILKSRALIGAVVRELRLHIVARPKRVFIFGGAIARMHSGDDVAGPFVGIRKYGWGGEKITVDRLDVPDRFVSETLTLVAGEGTHFRLFDPDGAALLEGEVGKAAEGRGVSIFVSELRGRPGLEFKVVRRNHDKTVEELQEDIRIAEKGKKTGILRMALDGRDPKEVAEILDALARGYVRQNVERRSAEAEKTLEFLETQLPALRAKLEGAERELEGYRSKKGTMDISLESKASIDRAVDIEKALADLKIEHAALRHRFTEDHPALVAITSKIRRLESERVGFEARLKKLPEAELESTRRLRDVKVANELFVAVLNKVQELKVVKEGTIGNVRVLDAAIIPVKPISPKKLPTVALSILIGLVVGVAGAFVKRAFDHGVEDPDALERALGIAVSASVPHSEIHAAEEQSARREHRPAALLAAHETKDLAVESLRSLRTSLQFALVEAPNAVIAVGGPAPGVGKSFVTANVAHLLGEAGKNVLVVDCDLRRGRVHHHFQLEKRGVGLADLILGQASIADVVHESKSSPNVHFITTGTIPPNPAELLGSERFHRLLTELAAKYDVVLLDTPPVLAVTDAVLVARHAGVNLLVLRAGKHPIREVSHALRVMARNGVRVHGLVMNDVNLDRGLGRRNAYHYQYRY